MRVAFNSSHRRLSRGVTLKTTSLRFFKRTLWMRTTLAHLIGLAQEGIRPIFQESVQLGV